MPDTRLFNVTGKEVFPPRPMNHDADDADAPRLRIVIAPPEHFLSPQTPTQAPYSASR